MTAETDSGAKRPTTVGEIMRRDFVTVPATESLDEALRIMRVARLRHLLVERAGSLVGILSYRDLQDRLMAEHVGDPEPGARPPLSLAVEEAMMDSPYVVGADVKLSDAAARLCNLQIGCLPVLERTADGTFLVGLVTEGDLLRAAYLPR